MKGIRKINTQVVVIGAGVLGLAIARELSVNHDVVLIEKRSKFGEETSSRNSEVIHSGIHYPRESKKTEWCIRGRELLYSFCQRFEVPFKKAGKYVVATSETEQAYIRQLKQHADSLGVPCRVVTKKEVKESEPLVEVSEALFFSESGIVDSHSLMAKLERLAVAQGALFAFNRRVKNAYPNGDQWEVVCENLSGDEEVISCEVVVNCAGLGAAELANQILNTHIYEHQFCRGRYLNLGSKFKNKFQSLVYPVPSRDGLGIHVTCDMVGMVRLGPDVDWCEKTSYAEVEKLYDCEWEKIKPSFWRSVQRYCPSIKLEDLSEGLIGVRPKLFIEGKPYRDFLSMNKNGSIHLLGMESPGLTASLAIAEAVRGVINSWEL